MTETNKIHSCKPRILTVAGNPMLEIRLHDGGLSYVDPYIISSVAPNYYNKAVIHTKNQNLVFASIHEVHEVMAVLAELPEKS